MKCLLIGSGAREHALARALKRSSVSVDLVCVGSNWNPGIRDLSNIFVVGSLTDKVAITDLARTHSIDFAVVGPEAPLAAGIVDVLIENDVPSVGPTKTMAQIETSKQFTRHLLQEFDIPASPRNQYFETMDAVASFLRELGDQYVVKFDGLRGGKGVKVAGDHLHSHAEAIDYCQSLIDENGTFVIEEKMEGEEFSLMSFSDGEHLLHMPPVQDHKRAFENDTGPNTGGMGSYSDADHLLPFLSPVDVQQAQQINQATIGALKEKFGSGYKGILYGGFMTTADGVKLVEYNARFGDPEGMNVLSILQSDFVGICEGILHETLDQIDIDFARQATVCKYAVPAGYPDDPVKGESIDISDVQNRDRLYFASVDDTGKGLTEAGSRTVAYVGIADSLSDAETEAETAMAQIKGPLFHRSDIGTNALIRKRIDHMKELRG